MSEHGDEISPEIAAQLDRFSKGDLQQLLDGHQQWIGIHQQEMEGLERRIEAHQRFVDNLSRRLRGHPPNSRHFRQPDSPLSSSDHGAARETSPQKEPETPRRSNILRTGARSVSSQQPGLVTPVKSRKRRHREIEQDEEEELDEEDKPDEAEKFEPGAGRARKRQKRTEGDLENLP